MLNTTEIRVSKNFFLLVILLFTFNLEVFSQKVFGLQAGLNISSAQFEGNDYVKPKYRFGLNAGISYLRKINRNLSFESGIFYKEKGQRIKSTGLFVMFMDGTSANLEDLEKYKIDYIQVPVSLNLNLNRSIHLSAGMYIARAVNGVYSKKSTFYDPQTNDVVREYYFEEEMLEGNEVIDSFNGEKRYKKFDYGLNFGFGYNFGKLLIKTEFDLGLTTALEITNQTMFNSDRNEFKNRSLSINLVYYFSSDYYKIRY
jgi:hypothetical protein